jgi:hypothetical protein
MRITIDTDDKGKVNIDTGEKIDTGNKGSDKPGLFQSTADIPVIDAGPAPVQEIERLQKGIPASEVSRLSASATSEDREAELPLNPLRAGAAAAYQNPANLRKKAQQFEGMSVAQDPSTTTIDGGSAQIPKDKESSDPRRPQPQ